MRRVRDRLGFVAGVLLMTAALADCSSNKSGFTGAGSGGSPGSGGVSPGQGGAVSTGGSIATGGTTIVSGTTIIGTGGIGSGGTISSGSGGSSVGTGGIPGTGGIGMGGATRSGTGGTTGTGGSIVGTGGSIAGTGGTVRSGTGGSGTGGAVLDGGTPDGAAAKCSEVTTQAECDARPDCHAVFEDPGTCGCSAPGCCARFKRCATGNTADCVGPALCEMVAPHCELPYVVAYTGLCYEGCVKQDECGTLPCPKSAPQDGTTCSTAQGTCYYEDCAGAGRTLAKCAAGSWQVTSAACGPYLCEAPITDAGALTCAAGKVCVVTTDSSFRTTTACVDQTCGTGPMSTTCIQGLIASGCAVKYKTSGVVVTCSTPVP